MRSNRSRISAWIFGLLLGLVSGRAWAAAPEAESVVVEVEPTVPDAELTHQWVTERAMDALSRSDVPLESGDSIRLGLGGTLFDYRIAVVLSRQGKTLPEAEQPGAIHCACGSDEMLARVDEAMVAGAETLSSVAAKEREAAAAAKEREAAAAAARAREERRRQDEKEEEERLRQQIEQAPYRPAGMGHVGIGLAGFGGALTIWGSIAVGVDPHEDAVKPGHLLVGIGVPALVGGVAMLVVDVVRCRRNRAWCFERRAQDRTIASRWGNRASGWRL